jgi:hypothetical protein
MASAKYLIIARILNDAPLATGGSVEYLKAPSKFSVNHPDLPA